MARTPIFLHTYVFTLEQHYLTLSTKARSEAAKDFAKRKLADLRGHYAFILN